MTVDGVGLLKNVSQQLQTPDRRMKEYYVGCVDELAEDFESVRKGEATLQDLAQKYNLVPAEKEEKA